MPTAAFGVFKLAASTPLTILHRYAGGGRIGATCAKHFRSAALGEKAGTIAFLDDLGQMKSPV